MRFEAYSSKLWYVFMLVLVGSFAAVIGLGWKQLPLPAQIVFGFLVSLSVFAIAYQLVSFKPVVAADENGLKCYKAFYGTIAWEDIEDSVRAPRVEKYQDSEGTGYHMSFSDAWRPIDVYVRNIEKYSKIIPPKLHSRLCLSESAGEHPGCFRFRVDLSGTTGSSERLQTVIEYYLAEDRKRALST